METWHTTKVIFVTLYFIVGAWQSIKLFRSSGKQWLVWSFATMGWGFALLELL